MDFNKKMTRAGGISVPAALRRDYGMEAGDKFNVSVNDEGSIVMKRTEGNCIFCGSSDNVKMYQGRYLCRKCTLELLKLREA